MKTLEREAIKHMDVILDVPGEIVEEFNQLPNRDKLVEQAFNDMIEKYRQSSRKTSLETNKWQNMLSEIEKNKTLYRGVSKQVQKASKEFREEFMFNENN